MKRVDLFRILIYIICLTLIFDFFFIVIEVNGDKITSAFTLFDRTFINKKDIASRIKPGGYYLYFTPFIMYIIALVVPILIPVFLYFTRTHRKTNLKESNLIFPLSIIGLIVYLFLIFFMSDIAGNHFSTGTNDLSKGYFGFLVGIIKYALIIYLTFNLRIKYRNNNDIVNIKKSSIFVITILVELILMFFFTPINKAIHYETYESMYGYESIRYTKFMYSPFYMMFKYKNYTGLNGKEEFYPYIILVLLCYIGVFALEFFKNKKSYAISIGLLFISLIVLTIGCIDSLDSFVSNYMTDKAHNFFNCVGASYYVTIFLIGSLIFLRVMQILDINLMNQTKELVNADEYVKEHSTDSIE